MKHMKSLAVVLVAAVSVPAFCTQTCQKSDISCYESGPSGSLSTPYRIDATGNVTSTGNQTFTGTGTNTLSGTNTTSGITNYTPLAVTVIPSSFTSFNVTATIMPLASGPASGVTIGVPGVSPFNTGPSTATATDGQFVIFRGTSSVSTVTLSSTTNSGFAMTMWLGAATRVIDNQHSIGLVFDALLGVWKEVFYR